MFQTGFSDSFPFYTWQKPIKPGSVVREDGLKGGRFFEPNKKQCLGGLLEFGSGQEKLNHGLAQGGSDSPSISDEEKAAMHGQAFHSQRLEDACF
jgi:hypothetical protein